MKRSDEIWNKILNCDVMEGMKQLPDKSINCIITSPPYWQLRDYGWSGQWGLEPTFTEYIDNLVKFMAECKRVLTDDGTIWINLGDTYYAGRGANGGGADSFERAKTGHRSITNKMILDRPQFNKELEKNLLLIPHRFAIRCTDELGLILRNTIIWAKPNGMPESVKDRFSKKHEYIFFFVKNQKYYFDMDSIRQKSKPLNRWGGNILKAEGISYFDSGTGQKTYRNREMQPNDGMKNPGDVSDFWDIITKSSNSDHYATFNTELITKPILAGCPADGIVLDPFCGTGTTLVRASELGRNVIGIEGSKKYAELAQENIDNMMNQTQIFKMVD